MSKDLISIIENSKVTHPLAISANKGNRYWNDFYKVSEDYKRVLSESEYNHFINKFQLDKEISHAQYLQFASEVTVVDYIIRNYCGFKNEPRYMTTVILNAHLNMRGERLMLKLNVRIYLAV